MQSPAPMHFSFLSFTRFAMCAGAIAFSTGCAPSSSAQDTRVVASEGAGQACVSSIDDWMERDTWPTDEVLLGDQLYGKSRLFNLSKSRGNPVAELAMQMATMQLNIAAGAQPDTGAIDALFEADHWLLDTHDDLRRSQIERADLERLQSILATFNEDAAQAEHCGRAHGSTETASL